MKMRPDTAAAHVYNNFAGALTAERNNKPLIYPQRTLDEYPGLLATFGTRIMPLEQVTDSALAAAFEWYEANADFSALSRKGFQAARLWVTEGRAS